MAASAIETLNRAKVFSLLFVLIVSNMVLDWISGQWYFAVHCHACGWQFPFASANDRLPQHPIELTCIDCEQTDFYCPKKFVRVEAK